METVTNYTEAAKVVLTSHSVYKYNSEFLLQILHQVDLNSCITELIHDTTQFKVEPARRSELRQNVRQVITGLKLKIDPKLRTQLK